jgi:hypothetical protein
MKAPPSGAGGTVALCHVSLVALRCECRSIPPNHVTHLPRTTDHPQPTAHCYPRSMTPSSLFHDALLIAAGRGRSGLPPRRSVTGVRRPSSASASSEYSNDGGLRVGMSAATLDDLSHLRECPADEKLRRETALAKSKWRPEECDDVAELAQLLHAEWEVGTPRIEGDSRRLLVLLCGFTRCDVDWCAGCQRGVCGAHCGTVSRILC